MNDTSQALLWIAVIIILVVLFFEYFDLESADDDQTGPPYAS